MPNVVTMAGGLKMVYGQIEIPGPSQGDHNERDFSAVYPAGTFTAPPVLIVSLRINNGDVEYAGVYRRVEESANGFRFQIGTNQRTSAGAAPGRSLTGSWIVIG